MEERSALLTLSHPSPLPFTIFPLPSSSLSFPHPHTALSLPILRCPSVSLLFFSPSLPSLISSLPFSVFLLSPLCLSAPTIRSVFIPFSPSYFSFVPLHSVHFPSDPLFIRRLPSLPFTWPLRLITPYFHLFRSPSHPRASLLQPSLPFPRHNHSSHSLPPSHSLASILSSPLLPVFTSLLSLVWLLIFFPPFSFNFFSFGIEMRLPPHAPIRSTFLSVSLL